MIDRGTVYGSFVFADATIAPIIGLRLRRGEIHVIVDIPAAVARAAHDTVLRMHGEDGSLIATIECGGGNLTELTGDEHSVLLVMPLGFVDKHCARGR